MDSADGVECEYLTVTAMDEALGQLHASLSDLPLPDEIMDSMFEDEAMFWYQQGGISGIEEQRVVVRHDLRDRDLCDERPSASESAFDKGVRVGRLLFAEKLNELLERLGHTPDYPQMSDPIVVCAADSAVLDPARTAAFDMADMRSVDEPLCEGFVPTTREEALAFAQAETDYLRGIYDGINDEFALAAVRIFRVVTCAVVDPLVVDMDGDGLELTPIEGGVNFDLYGRGTQQAAAWVQADDGFLALDRNGNGVIDDGNELFGNVRNGYEDGFAHLATLDDNKDGVMDTNDAVFPNLVVWQDINQDGVSTAFELTSVTELGVDSIGLAPSYADVVINGNAVPRIGHMTGPNTSLLVGDALLRTAPYPRLSLAE